MRALITCWIVSPGATRLIVGDTICGLPQSEVQKQVIATGTLAKGGSNRVFGRDDEQGSESLSRLRLSNVPGRIRMCGLHAGSESKTRLGLELDRLEGET